MRYLLNQREMKSCDASTVEKSGIPEAVLMERAALAVRDAALERFHPQSVLVLCGIGNNGGDGFAAARLLRISGVKADVLFLGKHDRMTDSCRLQEKIFLNYGGRALPEETPLRGYDLIIDALFGIGLSRDLLGRYADMVNAVNRADTPVLSIDIPSGISADSGQIMGTAVRADVTVTFQYEKLGQLLFPGAEYCGKLILADVGINAYKSGHESGEFSLPPAEVGRSSGLSAACGDGPAETFPENPTNTEPVFTLEESDLPSLLPRRHMDDNKGSCGKLLILAGDSGMAGAAILAARAAFRSGVGMVCVLTHPDNRIPVQTAVPEAIFAPWPEETDISRRSSADRWLSWCDAVAAGPGLGTSSRALSLLNYVLRSYTGALVLDADALNLMAAHPELTLINSVPAVITPHPGEMRRLLAAASASRSGTDAPDIGAIVSRPIDTALAYAVKTGMIVVLKGARTVVTDGTETMLNTCGNEGMAAAGSGDSLTGIIGSFLAQRLDPMTAAETGVLVHALAGDRAAEALGTRSLMSGDLSVYLPDVLRGIRF